jgi:hypothetical protein
MSKESFDQEKELDELEKELHNKISKLEQAPLRHGFTEELRNSLQLAIHNKEKEGASGIKWKKRGFFLQFNRLLGTRNVKLAAGFLLFVLLCGGFFWGWSGLNSSVKPALAGEIEIKALQEDKLGVAAESAFLLTSQNPLAQKTVQKHLKVQPAFEYALDKRAGGREYKIIPKKKLATNTVYKLTFDPGGKERESFSWAFQTKGQFKIMRTLPADRTTHVPVNTGIEIAFSHENFQLKKAGKYFTISPQVEGRFEKHKKTLVFIPQQLKAETLYTVTVKKGFPMTDSTEVLGEDYSFSFETAPDGINEEKFSFHMDNSLTEFSTAEAPAFAVYSYSDSKEKTSNVAVSVYRYAEHKSFIKALQKQEKVPSWASFAWKSQQEDFRKLTKVGAFKTDLLSLDNYSHYVTFPEKLPVGYYAAEIQIGEAKRQVWFQVTDLTVYEAQSAAKSLFWVNDLQTKKPVDGAELLLENLQLSFKGNAQGVIFVEQKLSIPSGSYALIKKDNREIVVPLFSTEETNFTNEGIDTRDYWKYLYIDRELFKPGDTVNFWGVLDPRKGAVPINEVEIELNGTGWGYYTRNENAPLLSKKVKIDSKIFTGEIQLPTLTPGYYYLKVKKGETILLSRGISVELYQKPAYKISVEPEKRAVFAGEQVNFLAQTAFFEGTPVPKTDLHYSVWDKEGTVVTDAQGRAIIPYAAGTDNSFSTYRSIYLGVNATLPEAGEISASSKVWVFQSKVNLEGNVTREGKSFILNTQLSQINLDRVNAGEYPEKENFVTGPVAGSLIKGSIYQDVWKKVENGNYYNFITKRVEKRYYYDHSTKNISDFEMVTDQAGKATFRGTLDTEGSYYLVLTVQDADGRISQRRVYISDTNYAYYNDDYYKYYHLQLEKREQGFVPGEKVSLTFMENTKELPSKKQGFLILQGQKEIESFAVLNQAKYEFTFQKEDLPNVHVGGVYFDGTSYQEASLELVRFDKEQKALKISIVTDKQEYKPKEKVKLQVQVTDGQNNPVQAKVNLNLVDEALYQLRDQQVDFLSELYNDFIPLFLRTRVSHYHPNLGGGAECGGEGDSERKDFFDTVLFTTVETNSRGEAVTEFTLPDNLTSWRVTYHGVTQDLQAGSGTSQILVRLSFFVEMVGKEVYLAGDVPVIVLRAYGSEVSANASVAYRMELSGPDGKKVTQKGQGIVGEGLDWQLPVLQEGKYTLVVEGKSGKYSDKLRKEFTVVNSFLERTSTTYQLLQENLKLQGSTREPTLVVFSDEEKSQYLRGLYQLAWQFGGRLEQKLAAQEARRLLEQYFTKQTFFYSENEESLQAYQQADGGISILPYAESEPILTALVASVGSSDFDRRTMAGYFYQQLETGKEKGEDVTLALWGLGALGEPVLLEINSYLAQKDLAPAEKVHLALAALDIGNGAYARKVYGELLDQYGEELGNSMRIKIGRDQDEIITATTQMALLSAKLGTAEKNKLYQYILENPGEELLNNLEQVQILKYNLRYMDSEPVSFTYELDGKKVKKTLKGRETFTLHVLPEDLSKIKFTAIKGKVGVMTAYSQTYQAEQIPDRNDLEVKRTYRLMGNTTNILQRGDLVEVELEYQIKNLAPRGNYELVDVLPAGLSYVQRPYQRTNYLSSNWSYPSEVKGQKITFNVSKVGKGDGVHRVVYYARVVSPGEFIAQGTLLSHVKYNDLCILGKEDRIVIK